MYACLPLLAQGETLGILHLLDSPVKNDKADEARLAEKCKLAKILADNIGLGIANLKLREWPDVILMDINLPGISGIQALKILRADPATAHIPVVALSANAIPRDIEKGWRQDSSVISPSPSRSTSSWLRWTWR